ncbi:MAG: anthranilate synthase component I family protein, partial [Armatimonadota bacterium]
MPSYRPLIREIACPPSALHAFSAVRDRPGAILLQSAAAEPKLGRWSFLASDPFLTFRSKGTRVQIHRPDGIEAREGDPFAVLRDLLADLRVERPPDAPPLISGAIGYFAYDLGRFVERIPEDTVDDIPVADCHLGFYGAVAAIDHVESRSFVSAIGAPETDPRAAQRLSEDRAAELTVRLVRTSEAPHLAETSSCHSERQRRILVPTSPSTRVPALPVTSNFTHADYIGAVARAKEYIAAGDIYEVNLSQRLSAPLATTPFGLYRRLARTNPAPFAAFFETPDCAVVSCSPERFLQVRGRDVETRPMKGTRARGATSEEDARLAVELVNSIKDRAENVMIVDLERNDIGRVCEFGSVHVPELFVLETYATVHQLVSTVRGRLRPDATSVDCLRACFPGGSITGAP